MSSPGGAGPVSSVNTPTMAGRRFGSPNPLRNSLPVSILERSLLPAGGVGKPDEGGERRPPPRLSRCAGIAARSPGRGGTLATTTLRTITSTRVAVTFTSIAFRAACRRPRARYPAPGHPMAASSAPRRRHRRRQVHRDLRNQRRGNVIELAILRPVQRGGGLDDRHTARRPTTNSRSGRRSSRPSGQPHVVLHGPNHGNAPIGPTRLHPYTRIEPRRRRRRGLRLGHNPVVALIDPSRGTSRLAGRSGWSRAQQRLDEQERPAVLG